MKNLYIVYYPVEPLAEGKGGSGPLSWTEETR